MRLQPDTITLGGRSFEVRPLTVAQVQAVEPLLIGSEAAAATIATAVSILRIALARDHAEAAAELDSLEAGAPEIGAAMAQVLRLGGFLPGEGLAGDGTPDAARVNWSGLYARLMAGAHYTPAEIDAMPAQDAFALLAHWRDHPPAHEILAAVHRITRAAPPDAADPSGIGALMARHPDGTVRG